MFEELEEGEIRELEENVIDKECLEAIATLNVLKERIGSLVDIMTKEVK